MTDRTRQSIPRVHPGMDWRVSRGLRPRGDPPWRPSRSRPTWDRRRKPGYVPQPHFSHPGTHPHHPSIICDDRGGLQATNDQRQASPAPAVQRDYWRGWDPASRRFLGLDNADKHPKYNPACCHVFPTPLPSVSHTPAMRAHGGLPSGNARPDWPTPGGRGGWGRGRGTWGADIPGRFCLFVCLFVLHSATRSFSCCVK